jgi:hypothetical protein
MGAILLGVHLRGSVKLFVSDRFLWLSHWLTEKGLYCLLLHSLTATFTPREMSHFMPAYKAAANPSVAPRLYPILQSLSQPSDTRQKHSKYRLQNVRSEEQLTSLVAANGLASFFAAAGFFTDVYPSKAWVCGYRNSI